MVIILYLGTSSACFGSPLQLISALICLIACVEGVDLIVNKNEDLSAISIYEPKSENSGIRKKMNVEMFIFYLFIFYYFYSFFLQAVVFVVKDL